MPTRVLLPKFGQTVETSEITAWMKKEGEPVKKGEILCEIATDKSSLEVESQYDGILLKILLAPGKTAPVGCVMAVMGDAGEALSDALVAECLATQKVSAATAPAPAAGSAAASPAPAAPKPAPVAAAPVASKPLPPPTTTPSRPAATASAGRQFASPRARKFAAAAEVPVAVLVGSGENGRVVEADVHAYIEAIGTVSPAARTQAFQRGVDLRGLNGSGPGGQVTIADLASKPAARNGHGSPAAKPEKAFALGELPPLSAKLEKLNPMRRAIAANMLASAQTIPAFQVEVSVDAASLIARRETAKAAGEKVSFGDIIARAVALTIRKHPAFAATWTDQGIQFRDRVHIGFAVALPGGLVVPVVGDCDQRSVGDIAQVSAGLVDKARTGKLAPDDYTGAVFTLSNLGSFPVDRFVAIVPPGQSGIIAIGRIRDEVVVRGGGFFAAKLMSLTLSADHRYIDGADGAAFMKDLKEILEHADVV